MNDRLPIMLFSLIAALGTTIILSVYFIEYVLGYLPCPMCLWQRLPWFFLIIIALLGFRFEKRGLLTASRICLGLILVCLLVSVVLAVYHVGVEWRWWQGPSSCSGFDLEGSFEKLKQSLLSQPPVRCDEVEFRLLGGSLALWNAVVSAITLTIILISLGGMLVKRSRQSDHV